MRRAQWVNYPTSSQCGSSFHTAARRCGGVSAGGSLAASPAILVPVPMRSYFLYAVKTPHRKSGTLKYHRFAIGKLFAMARTKGARSNSTIRRAMMARRAQFAVIGDIDTTMSLDSLAVLEEVMRHFYCKAKILESMGQEGDYEEVDKAWSE